MPEWATIRRRIFLYVFRWKIQLRNMPLAKFWGIVLAIVIVAVPLWFHFGTDAALPVLADATPILLAIVGVVMSYIQPKRESHRATTMILIVAGLLGSAILSVNRMRVDAAHQAEMKELNRKVDRVGEQNTQLGNFLISAKDTGTISEADRKRGIESVLRNEYILMHNPIDPEILAGVKSPPEDWMNNRLREMKETWTFKAPMSKSTQVGQQVVPEEKKAKVVFSFYKPDMTGDPQTILLDPITDHKFSVSIGAIVVGDTPAENLQIWIRECKTCEWVSPNPPGFPPSDSDHQFDRGIQFPEMLPNVGMPKWDFTIQVAPFPKVESVAIACYYACKNCAPVDWKNPQILWVTQSLQSNLRLRSPSIFYTPEPVH